MNEFLILIIVEENRIRPEYKFNFTFYLVQKIHKHKGGIIFTLLIVLNSLNLPVDQVPLILAVDWIL